MRRYLLAGAAALALIGVAAGQQNLTNRSMTGNEVVVVAQGGPGGPSIFASTAQMKNASIPQILAATTGPNTIPITSSSVFLTGAIGTITLNLPASPYDGQIVQFINATGTLFAGTATVATTDGSTIVNGATGSVVSTLASGASVEYQYVLSTNSWYKIR